MAAADPRAHEAGFAELGCCINSYGLDHILAAYGSHRVRTAAIRFDVALMPEPLKTLVSLLVLAEPVPRDQFHGLLPARARRALLETGLALESGDMVQLQGVRLVRHFGVWIFCEPEHPGMTLYYGDDSLALGRLLPPARGRVLDLCCGVGAQGILCALTASRVICVDQNPAVERLFWVNAALNGVTDRVEFRLGDARECHIAGEFDLVCCNPPLLPIPPGIPYPFVGNGGPDGQDVARAVLRRLPHMLAREGRCVMVGTLLGDQAGPDLSPIAESLPTDLDVLMILPGRAEVTEGAPMLEALAQTVSGFSGMDFFRACKMLADAYRRQQKTHLYSYLLLARHAPRNRTGQLQVTLHYLRSAEFWWV